MTGLWVFLCVCLVAGAALLAAFIWKSNSDATAASTGYHPVDQRSYDLGRQAVNSSGPAGALIAQGVDPKAACDTAKYRATMFKDDPVLRGALLGGYEHPEDLVPSNAADYLQGCLDAVNDKYNSLQTK